MNICMMTNTYLPHVGGVARSVHTFAVDFRRQGHEVRVVAPTFPGIDEMPPEQERGVIRVPAVQRFNGSDFSVRLPMIAFLNPALQGYRPDIIHSHHPFLLGDTALRFAADCHCPVVFTHHTLYEEYLHYVPFPRTAMRHFVIELSTHYANLCDAVIAPSESIAALIRKRGVSVPIEVIPTGIDLARFAGGDGGRFRKEAGIPNDAFVVGTLGRLAAEKNLGYLGRAIRRFMEAAPEAVFLAVGSGPAEDDLRRVFEGEGVADRLFLPGKKSGEDLFDAYKAMDIFAFSSFSETQGLVLAEAMASGLPVVALDASGVREVVREERNGRLLSATATEAEFAAAVEGLWKDRSRLKAFRGAALETAKDFSREVTAARALALYERTERLSRRKREEETQDGWAGLLHRLRVEWDLISEKAESAFDAFRSEDDEEEETPGGKARR